MRHLTRVVFAGLLGTAAVMAQPVVNSVLNSASYALPGMPNYGVSQGSLFVAFGRNLGPPGLNQVSAYPLPTALNGVSAKVTVGGVTVDCIIMNSYGAGTTPATQVVGILPSNTPVGTGTFVLTYNGQPSAPASITVVAHVFGIYAVNAGGSGPGVVTDAGYQVRLITASATTRQTLIIWGTGLGAVTFDEKNPPVPRDMTELDVKVYVGGKLATVRYRGRSGGAGLDQINFDVPDGVQGCYVSLVVVVNGISGNWVTIPVAANNGACSDPGGLTAQEIEAARARGSLKSGSVRLSRSAQSFTIPGLPSGTNITDSASASFAQFDLLGLISAQGFGGFSTMGSCAVFQWAGEEGGDFDPVTPTFLNAGNPLTLNGPKGSKQIPLLAGQTGVYVATLGSQGPIPIPGVPQELYLDPGTYTITGPGGTNVGGFNASLTLPATFTWLNQASINNIPRNQDLQVTWSGGAPNGVVSIIGGSAISTPMAAGASFICTAQAGAAQFTIPSVVLSALPASGSQEGFPMGSLTLGTSTEPVRFNATGLDVATFSFTSTSGKSVAYQ